MSITLQTNTPVSFQKKVAPQQKSFNNIAFKGQLQQDTFQKSTVQNTGSNISFNGIFSFLKKDPIEKLYKKNEGLHEIVNKVMAGDDKAIEEFKEFIDNDPSKKKVRGELFSKVIKDLKKDILSGENVAQASETLVKLGGVKPLVRKMLMSGALSDIHSQVGIEAGMMFPYGDIDSRKSTPALLQTLFSEINPLNKEAREQYDTLIKDYILKPKISHLLIYNITLKYQAVKQFVKNASSVEDVKTVIEFIKGPDKIYGDSPCLEIGFIVDSHDITAFKAETIKSLPDILERADAGKGVRAEVKSDIRGIIESEPSDNVKLACYEVLDKL